MLTTADIHPDWKPEDVALFVGLVANIQGAIAGMLDLHRRAAVDDTVQDLIAKATLTALRAEHLAQGLRTHDLSLAFIEFEARLRAEIVDLKATKQNFLASLRVEGRA